MSMNDIAYFQSKIIANFTRKVCPTTLEMSEVTDNNNAVEQQNEQEDPSKFLQILPDDGARLENVKVSLKCTVERLLASWKCSLLSKYFPSLASKHEVLLQTVISSIAEALKLDLYKGLSELVESEMRSPLQELSNMVTSSCSTEGSTQAWRPSGVPLQDVATHDLKMLRYEHDRLKDGLASEHQTTLQLQEQVLSLRYKIQDQNREIKRRHALLRACNVALED
ncbi:hypothetical protein FHG87_013557 [Trinorchestia longiramus]|nr:hypothetical protein FHG87_013557 [Trinorchestia longiramus]